MKFKFTITFKSGVKDVAVIEAVREVPAEHFTVADTHKVLETEQFLERMLGLRVHVDLKQITHDDPQPEVEPTLPFEAPTLRVLEGDHK